MFAGVCEVLWLGGLDGAIAPIGGGCQRRTVAAIAGYLDKVRLLDAGAVARAKLFVRVNQA
jgi:hypothetical protein